MKKRKVQGEEGDTSGDDDNYAPRFQERQAMDEDIDLDNDFAADAAADDDAGDDLDDAILDGELTHDRMVVLPRLKGLPADAGANATSSDVLKCSHVVVADSCELGSLRGKHHARHASNMHKLNTDIAPQLTLFLCASDCLLPG
jgi:hypothetical protein